MYTLGVLTLGCKVNQYESEAIAEAAEKAGFKVSEPSLPCDVYVINTCTVTSESDRKSRQTIRRAHSINPSAKIIVTGCLSQVSPETVTKIEGVDFVCGNGNKMSVIDAALSLLGEKTNVTDTVFTDCSTFEPMRINKFPRTRAYIKIEDGCESHCTYCIIPEARGKIRSKQPVDVLDEIKALRDGGCREVVLTGIETASYGKDLGSYGLAELLREADVIAGGSMRIRLGSLDPSLIRPGFVGSVAGLRSLAPHFHLSLQSGSDGVLARMKRKYNVKMATESISLLRESIPDVQLTTDLIVGFPGETDAEFEETLAFVREIGLLRAHVFVYSRRKGTPAASMPGQIPPDVSHIRSQRLIALQNDITSGILRNQIGKTDEVLFETDNNGMSYGHTPSFIEVCMPSSEPLHAKTKRVRFVGQSNGVLSAVPEESDGDVI